MQLNVEDGVRHSPAVVVSASGRWDHRGCGCYSARVRGGCCSTARVHGRRMVARRAASSGATRPRSSSAAGRSARRRCCCSPASGRARSPARARRRRRRRPSRRRARTSPRPACCWPGRFSTAEREVGPPVAGSASPSETRYFWRRGGGLPAPDMQPINFSLPMYEPGCRRRRLHSAGGMIGPASRGLVRLSGRRSSTVRSADRSA